VTTAKASGLVKCDSSNEISNRGIWSITIHTTVLPSRSRDYMFILKLLNSRFILNLSMSFSLPQRTSCSVPVPMASILAQTPSPSIFLNWSNLKRGYSGMSVLILSTIALAKGCSLEHSHR
jgi:hypothetical protein